MIDHLSVGVSDLAAARTFYETALAPLGYRIVFEFPDGVFSMGVPTPGEGDPGGELWFVPGDNPTGIHLALSAKDAEQVQAFYEAALAAGGADNGGPGERPQYHPGYYAAFVHDPDGHNIEAVCHDWSSQQSSADQGA